MGVLKIKELSKNYGTIQAVDSISLEINKGEVYGFLGPNGSGKTTSLAMLTGVVMPTKGTYEWFGGMEISTARKKIGTLLETPNFYPYLNAVENLKIVAHIKGTSNSEIDSLLETVNLQERKKSPFKAYSLGMKQRLAIAAAMLGNPEVLIFDEPTNGLDPQGIADVRNTIKSIAEQGKTILLASHILDEVEKLCTHAAILKKGILIKSGRVGAMIHNKPTVELSSEQVELLEKHMLSNNVFSEVKRKGNIMEALLSTSVSAAELNQMMFHQNIILTHLVIKQRSLESEFLELTA